MRAPKRFTKLASVTAIVCVVTNLSGCMTAATIAGSAVSGALLQKVVLKQSESKPPKYIDISQEGRIITASFEIKGFVLGNNKASQMRGFNKWAIAAVVREAPLRGCVNIINAFSANQGVSAGASVGTSKIGSSLKFKCLDKETMASEQDLLSDKQVIYKEQLQYIEQNPEMIRYSQNKES